VTADDESFSGDAPEMAARLEGLERQVRVLQLALEDHAAQLEGRLNPALAALGIVHDDDAGARRRLLELRASAEYEAAFTDPEPLVSVVIPTWNRPELLAGRAIPSALAQTHPAIEVVVVGDAAACTTAEAVQALGDPRVRFLNLGYRSPRPEDPTRAWYTAGTRPFNEGVDAARGSWIAPLGDDDAFDPGHVERLLAAAREQRLEFVYGLIRMTMPDGSQSMRGEFPPRLGEVNLQAAVYHRGLRFMELELGHAYFDTPNDWGLVRRLMRIGVRMGMVDEVSVDYWPSVRSDLNRPDAAPDRLASRLAAAEAELTDARCRVAELTQQLQAGRAELSVLRPRIDDLQRTLDSVVRSRSWRLTAPLRGRRRRG
jgi:hypothetical protein